MEMNMSHAVQGDEMNISNQLLTHYINLNILAHVMCTFQLISLLLERIIRRKYVLICKHLNTCKTDVSNCY